MTITKTCGCEVVTGEGLAEGVAIGIRLGIGEGEGLG
jgi:hypothetical protein